jgi:hypothetical protein
MSEIKVDTLTGKTSVGDITVTSEGGAATMQLQQGMAKAWVFFYQTSQVIQGSLNISSLTDAGTGESSLSPLNPMLNGTDNVITVTIGSGYSNRNGVFNLPRTTVIKLEVFRIDNLSVSDAVEISSSVHGSLA